MELVSSSGESGLLRSVVRAGVIDMEGGTSLRPEAETVLDGDEPWLAASFSGSMMESISLEAGYVSSEKERGNAKVQAGLVK